MINYLSKINKSYYFLFFIILFQILILMHYMNIRTNTHCDEVWTYGYSNSHNAPFFWENGLWPSSNNNFYNKWHDGKEWFNYITVQPNETFSFDRVYNNLRLDMSPPLYFYVLHFICSFFPNKFSLWYGQIINILAFIITQVFLFKLIGLLLNNKYALAVITYFGFSMAAINIFIYIRQYSFFTMFCIILNYIVVKILIDEKINIKIGISLFIIGFLGFLTQHYFAIYYFALSIGFIIYFISKKNISLISKYGIISLLSFITYFAYFPYIFIHLNRVSGAVTSKGLFSFFPFKEMFTGLAFIINYTIGIETEKIISIFRELTHFLNYLNPYVNPFIILLILFSIFFFILKKENANKIIIILLEFLTVLIMTSSYTILNMQLYFGRYFFPLMPFFCILSFSLIEWILSKMKITNRIKDFVLFALIIIFILASHKNSAMEYCFTNKPSREEIAQLFKGANIISVQQTRYEHFIHTKSQEFRCAKRVFPTREYEAEEINKAVNSITSKEKNYIIVPENEFGLLIINFLKKEGYKPRFLFTDNHPNYDQMVFQIYSKETNNN